MGVWGGGWAWGESAQGKGNSEATPKQGMLRPPGTEAEGMLSCTGSWPVVTSHHLCLG